MSKQSSTGSLDSDWSNQTWFRMSPKPCERLLCILAVTYMSAPQTSVRPHPDLQLDPLVVAVNRLHLEVDAHSADKGVTEGVVSIAEQKRRLSNAAVSNDQQLKHVVKVLVGTVPLPKALVCFRHLRGEQSNRRIHDVQPSF